MHLTSSVEARGVLNESMKAIEIRLANGIKYRKKQKGLEWKREPKGVAVVVLSEKDLSGSADIIIDLRRSQPAAAPPRRRGVPICKDHLFKLPILCSNSFLKQQALNKRFGTSAASLGRRQTSKRLCDCPKWKPFYEVTMRVNSRSTCPTVPAAMSHSQRAMSDDSTCISR